MNAKITGGKNKIIIMQKQCNYTHFPTAFTLVWFASITT